MGTPGAGSAARHENHSGGLQLHSFKLGMLR